VSEREGRIITFYSYKGGTGRSMALANVAFILASHEKKVLMIDWDLEAPGLHRYFHPLLIDPDLTSTEGLIDFVWDFAMDTVTPPDTEGTPGETTWAESASDLTPYTVGLDYDFGDGCLDFVPAGRQGPEYAARVNAFNWENFYTRLRGGVLLETVRKRLRREYDFVLIDSRTGVSDTSGICTVQMPDQLVVCFTCNNQSIRGAAAVVEAVLEQRGKRELQVFPVLMRVDLSEKDKLDASRDYARKTFAKYPSHLDSGRRDRYWRKSEVLYHSYYAYEEILTVFGDSPESDKTLLSDVETLVGHLTNDEIGEIRRIPEPQRLDYKAKYLRAEAPPTDVPTLRDPQSIELYQRVRKAKEEWERSGRRPVHLLPNELSRELSYAHEARNELLRGAGFQEFIEQSATVNQRRRRVDIPLAVALIWGGLALPFPLTILTGMCLHWLWPSLGAIDFDKPEGPLFTPLLFAFIAVLALSAFKAWKALRSSRIYDTLLGLLLPKSATRRPEPPSTPTR